ncbi:hypothetical protein LUZ60_015052 [Juncus effusus]|nr:hypothetical protein LUZ60_015052 [Juncus effusus]
MYQFMMGDNDSLKCYGVVIIIQLIYTWMFIVSKAALNAGLGPLVFLFYRQAVASLFLVPISIVAKWGTAPKLPFILLLKFFMLALIGITIGLNLSHIGLKYTSETVASATFNAIPVITFFLAFLLRMETLIIKRIHGMAKVAGVVLCLAGVIVLAFYVGPAIHPLNHHRLFHQSGNSAGQVHSKGTWIKGTFLLIFAQTAWSFWLVVQGLMLRECPSKLLFTTIQCETIHLGSVLGGILTIVGLYSVLWGKSKENKLILTSNGSSNTRGVEQNAILPMYENHTNIEGISRGVQP